MKQVQIFGADRVAISSAQFMKLIDFIDDKYEEAHLFNKDGKLFVTLIDDIDRSELIEIS